MKSGDLILYDKFGSSWPDLSPSIIPDDFGVGIIIDIFEEPPGGEDNSCAVVAKEDGTKGTFSLSYLVQLDYFSKQ